MPDVGTGAILNFVNTNLVLNCTAIQHRGYTREALELTSLNTTGGRVFMPGDLYDPGEVVATFRYDPNTQPPLTNTTETIKITFPIPSGSNNAATFTCSGFVTNFEEPNLEVDTVMDATVTIKLTGNTNWTDAS